MYNKTKSMLIVNSIVKVLKNTNSEDILTITKDEVIKNIPEGILNDYQEKCFSFKSVAGIKKELLIHSYVLLYKTDESIKICKESI
jgi:hypothetical protein